jgi:hypothetical protein
MSTHIDHLELISTRGSNALAHFSGPSDDLYEHIVSQAADGKKYNYLASQSGSLHASTHVSFFSPATALPAISTASQLDIRIPAGSCGAVTSISIRLDLENQSALNNSSYGGVANLFTHIELWAEGGSMLVQRWTDDALRVALHYLNRDQAERYQTEEGSPFMGPGVSRTFFLRLPYSIFESSHMNIASLSSDLYLRLFFRGGNSYDTADYLTLNGAQAVVSWLAFPPTIQRAISARARASVLDYRYYQNQFQKEILTLAPSTRYSIRLSSMQGVVISVAMIIRAAGATGTALVGNYVRPESFELLDSSGKSILGGNSFPIQWNDHQKQQQGLLTPFGTAFSNITGTLLIPLAVNVKGSLAAGAVKGHYTANGYEQLAFVTDAGTTGAHEVAILWSVAERVRKDGGRISVHSS